MLKRSALLAVMALVGCEQASPTPTPTPAAATTSAPTPSARSTAIQDAGAAAPLPSASAIVDAGVPEPILVGPDGGILPQTEAEPSGYGYGSSPLKRRATRPFFSSLLALDR